ncbi:ABC transporter substrate-binding protein [Paenibacillus arenilitoris]|uniref:Extracellular solute-binding protein n=1 Tax=Paenibacillus arenilitoris TaxID=2772299 RepID=A0A927CP11_9BACL|nr:extracellular solute-binding protein [Paenibacillus arenilitoris]MBD2870837.1 extracellular solute-binding protein [Paenibacillus arenilitoris]
MSFGKGKSRSSALLLFILFAMLLAGCGAGPAGSNTDSQPSPAGTDAGTAEGDGAKDPKQISATIKVWDWDEAFHETMIPEFNKLYPNIKVEYTVVSNTDYLQKLQSGIVSGSDIPDVIMGEVGYRGKLFDLDILDDLEGAPYNFQREQMLDYVVPLMTNSEDKLVGIEQQIAVAGLAYRRDLAKEYLGTDNPDEIEGMIKDWDAFTAKGIEIKEKSGGKVLMLPGLLDAYFVLNGQRGMEYIKGEDIDLTGKMKPTLDRLFDMRDKGIIGKLENGSPSWAASFASGDYLFYPSATWSPKWQVAANDKDGSGRWGLVAAPEGSFTLGGTSVSVYKDSKVKEAAWAYMNFCYLSDEGTKIAAEKFGFLPGVKSFYENNRELIDKGSEFDAFFGGQNLSKYFVEKVVPGVSGQPQTKYEAIVTQAFKTLYPLWTKDASIDANTAMSKYIDEVKSKARDANVK